MAAPDTREPSEFSQRPARSSAPFSKRKRDTYDPSTEEQLPNDPWYQIKYESITQQVIDMCDELTIPLERYAAIDKAIENLLNQAKEAKNLPSLKKLTVAVLGEQGIGKSTLLNALFDRKILDKSGDPKACTAYCTMIVHKEGAEDDAVVSDVTIEFFQGKEIVAFIKDMINRWADVHTGNQSDETQNDSDEDDDNFQDEERTTNKSRPALSKEKRQGAETAKEFFEIVCNTENDLQSKSWLEKSLKSTDIREGDFRIRCLKQAKKRLADIATEQHAHLGVSVRLGELDENLGKMRSQLKKIWPFVKVVTIATGHLLLRYGMCFLDLPGYGDTSQLRDAVVNKYRGEADYEIVVAPHSRIETSVKHDRYLERSLEKGTDKTMLVMTKSDDLFDEDDYLDQIAQIEEEPFPDLIARLEYLKEVAEEDDEDLDIDMLYQVTQEAAEAYVKRQGRLIIESMRDKGIRIFSTSPKTYMTWKNGNRRTEPLLTAATSGIPNLRQHLFSLPANVNLENFKKHVFKLLPRFRKRASRVLEKHPEDERYAQMRRSLEQQIPAVRLRLEDVAETQLKHLVAPPWSSIEERKVIRGIENLIEQKWKHPLIIYSGFAKMLRENGIPTNGEYFERNLNEELLGVMIRYINDWNVKMSARAGKLVQCLNETPQAFFEAIQSRIDRSKAVPALKNAAKEALADARQGVEEACAALLESLYANLADNHMRYTNEVDIFCPIAKEMIPRYEIAQNVAFIGAGQGAYKRTRSVLRTSIVNPDRYHSRLPPMKRICPLVRNLKEQIMSRQCDIWNESCHTFITEVDTQLQEFSRVAGELLVNAEFMTEEHRRARELLKSLLVGFDQSLEQVQNQFAVGGGERAKKRTKVKKEEIEEQDAPLFELEQLERQAGELAMIPRSWSIRGNNLRDIDRSG